MHWTSIPSAALHATHAGQLAEDVNGSNVVLVSFGQISTPLDIQPTALANPIGIVYDADGAVTDTLLGIGAGAADLCSTNAAYGGPDAYSPDGHLAHALVILNGNCAHTSGDLPHFQYELARVLGRVIGLDWAELNENVVTQRPSPTADDYAGFPLMHAIEPRCGSSPPCFAGEDQPKMDDRAAVSRLYPVTSANIASFAGKQLYTENTGRIYGVVYFNRAAGNSGQPMQGVKVVARWINPATNLPSTQYTAASISGFLFRGNAGNPVTGFSSPTGGRYDQFGSDDPSLEGYYDLSGLEFPDGRSTAQYQITLEAVGSLCVDSAAVGPYRTGQVQPSGTAEPIIISVTKGSEITRDIVMSGSANELGIVASTFAAPAKLPPAEWRSTLSGYGDVDYYSFSARADRTMMFKVTAVDELNQPTQNKSQPVLGIWADSDAEGSPPQVAATHFNTFETGTTALNLQFLSTGEFKIGVADDRGDGRPDFRYRAYALYADTVSPDRASVQGGTALTIRGMGFRPGTTASIGVNNAPVISLTSNSMVIAAPQLPDGVQSISIQTPDGSKSNMINALTYGAGPGDRLILLQARIRQHP